MTGAQGRGYGGVTAGNLHVRADPLHGCSALVRGEAEGSQIQLLPWCNRGGPAADHAALHEPGAGGAEPAVTVENQDR